MKSIVLLALFSTILAYSCNANNLSLQDSTFEIQKLNDSLLIINDKEYGTNIGVVIGESSIVLIDPMPGENRLEDLNHEIKKHSSLPVEYVINTHNHEDHTGGNEFFKTRGAIIIDKQSLEKDSSGEMNTAMQKLGLKIAPVKSHTYEDILVYHQASNSLFVGDVFDNSWHPTFYAAGLKGLKSSIKKMFEIANSTSMIVPGHGKLAQKDVVLAFQKNTSEWVNRVNQLHQKGMSVEEMMTEASINKLLQRFNTENKQVFIPERAFQRFIERTIEVIENSEN